MKETVSQKWQHNRELRQIEFETHLANIQEKIDEFNAELKELVATTGGESPEYSESVSRFVNKAVETLDENWPYYGSKFLVAGKWYKGKLNRTASINGVSLDITSVPEEVLRPAVGLGFGARRNPDTGEFRFGLSLASEPATSERCGSTAWGTLEYTFQPYTYLEPQDAALQYIGENGEQRVNPADIGEIRENLASANALYRLYTEHPGTSFYRQSAERQIEYIDSFVAPIYDALPAPESQTDVMLHATTDVLYSSSGGGVLDIRQAKPGKPLEVYGEVIGFTVLDLVVATRGIRKLHTPDELIDSDAGVCVAILEPNESPNDVLYIPSRKTKLDFTLHGDK